MPSLNSLNGKNTILQIHIDANHKFINPFQFTQRDFDVDVWLAWLVWLRCCLDGLSISNRYVWIRKAAFPGLFYLFSGSVRQQFHRCRCFDTFSVRIEIILPAVSVLPRDRSDCIAKVSPFIHSLISEKKTTHFVLKRFIEFGVLTTINNGATDGRRIPFQLLLQTVADGMLLPSTLLR